MGGGKHMRKRRRVAAGDEPPSQPPATMIASAAIPHSLATGLAAACPAEHPSVHRPPAAPAPAAGIGGAHADSYSALGLHLRHQQTEERATAYMASGPQAQIAQRQHGEASSGVSSELSFATAAHRAAARSSGIPSEHVNGNAADVAAPPSASTPSCSDQQQAAERVAQRSDRTRRPELRVATPDELAPSESDGGSDGDDACAIWKPESPRENDHFSWWYEPGAPFPLGISRRFPRRRLPPPAFGYACGALVLLFAALSLHGLLLSKALPPLGIPALDALAADRYYCLLAPATVPVAAVLLYFNWLGMQLFKYN